MFDSVHRNGAVAIAATGLLVVLWREWRSRPRNVRHLPTCIPIFGHLIEYAQLILRGKSLDFWQECVQRTNSSTFVLRIFGLGYMICTADPNNVEHMLKTKFDNYEKGPRFHRTFVELLGHGIFNVDGTQWLGQRKTASHMFSQKSFRNHMFSTFLKHSKHVASLLQGPAAQGETVDMFDMFNRFTLDSIGEIGFGCDLGTLENKDHPVLASFDGAQHTVMLRFTITALVWKLMSALRISIEGIFRQQVKVLDSFAYGVVEDAWNNAQSGSQAQVTRHDFLSLFISGMNMKDSVLESQNKAFLRDLVMNFMIAGRDTTAQALTWTLYLLAQHPEITERVYDELIEAFGETDDPTFGGLQRLTFTQCVIHEVLRLYPSVPKIPKEPRCRDVLPDGTIVPAGCYVTFVPYLMGRMKSIWGEDALEFKPSRWLDNGFPSLYAYPVFNAGPRECLGRRMAWLEMKTCLAVIVRRYHLKLGVNPSDVRIMESVTLPVLGGLPIIFTARASAGSLRAQQ